MLNSHLEDGGDIHFPGHLPTLPHLPLKKGHKMEFIFIWQLMNEAEYLLQN